VPHGALSQQATLVTNNTGAFPWWLPGMSLVNWGPTA
jgi:hypothetical protein